MKLTLNKTFEEKKPIHTQRIELVDEDSEFAWVCRFTEDQLEKIYEETYELIEVGDEWEHLVKLTVFERLKAKTSKIKTFKSDYTSSLPVAIDMAFQEVVKLSGLADVKVKQTKLVMPPNEKKTEGSSDNEETNDLESDDDEDEE